jgi:hypothetical protein
MRWEKVQTNYDRQKRKKVPVLDENDQPITNKVGIIWITGKITVELDGKPYSHADVGRCVFTGDTPQEVDMAVAGAATDCLKRCFRQLGDQFGNSLYDKEVAKNAGKGSQKKNPPSKPRQPDNNSPLKYEDGDPVDLANQAELSAYEAFKDAHAGKIPASRQALRAWTTTKDNGGNSKD